MSTPIIELIAKNIEAAVNAITVANSFNQDLKAVRPKRWDYADVVAEDGTVMIVQFDEAEDDSRPINLQQWKQIFLLSALVLNSEKATASIDTRINQVISDIRKKILQDPYRGGLAIDTLLKPSKLFDNAEDDSGTNVFIEVSYRTKYNDPYTQG